MGNLAIKRIHKRTRNMCSDCGYVGNSGILPPGQIITGIEDESDTNTE